MVWQDLSKMQELADGLKAVGGADRARLGRVSPSRPRELGALCYRIDVCP